MRLASGNLPTPIDYEHPADIIIGHGVRLAQIEPIEAGDGIRQRVARNRSRVIVNALAPGKRALELYAMTDFFYDSNLECLIGGASSPVDQPDRSCTPSNRSAAGSVRKEARGAWIGPIWSAWPEVTRGAQCR